MRYLISLIFYKTIHSTDKTKFRIITSLIFCKIFWFTLHIQLNLILTSSTPSQNNLKYTTTTTTTTTKSPIIILKIVFS